MFWYIIASISFVVAISLLVFTRIRDKRYEKMKTSEAMSPELRTEIEEEREAALLRREKFTTALKEAENAKE